MAELLACEITEVKVGQAECIRVVAATDASDVVSS